MYYKFTVSQHGAFLFDTGKSITETTPAVRFAALLDHKFTARDGFRVECVAWEESGTPVLLVPTAERLWWTVIVEKDEWIDYHKIHAFTVVAAPVHDSVNADGVTVRFAGTVKGIYEVGKEPGQQEPVPQPEAPESPASK